MVEIAVYYLRHMIIRRSILHTYHLLLAAMVCSLSIYAHASDDDSIEKISKRHLKIFTHGDTSFAKFDTERNASGLAMDTLQCISENLGFSYEVVFAPLSRAGNIISNSDNAVWFPAGSTDDPKRKARMVGPIGDVKFLWYQSNANVRDVNTEDFKKNALVTAYKGSAFEAKLRSEGYRWMQGSADHNRLLSMLLSQQVDALLAVDFTFKLDPSMQRMVDNRLSISTYRNIPVYFELSEDIHNTDPALITAMREELDGCLHH